MQLISCSSCIISVLSGPLMNFNLTSEERLKTGELPALDVDLAGNEPTLDLGDEDKQIPTNP